MDVLVNRFADNGKASLGFMSIDVTPQVFTLEDEHRDIKVKKETRIPEGRYIITFKTDGGHHEQFLKKYGPDWHKGMLWVRDVPGFQDILIHIGNTELDTDGCTLTGMAADASLFTISSSTKAYEKVYPIIRDALLKGEEVWITYKDSSK